MRRTRGPCQDPRSLAVRTVMTLVSFGSRCAPYWLQGVTVALPWSPIQRTDRADDILLRNHRLRRTECPTNLRPFRLNDFGRPRGVRIRPTSARTGNFSSRGGLRGGSPGRGFAHLEDSQGSGPPFRSAGPYPPVRPRPRPRQAEAALCLREVEGSSNRGLW